MSLKHRLFLLVAGLVVLLVGAQAALVRHLAADLSHEVDHVALDVSESLLTSIHFEEKILDGAPLAEQQPSGEARPQATLIVEARHEARTGTQREAFERRIVHAPPPHVVALPSSAMSSKALADHLRRLLADVEANPGSHGVLRDDLRHAIALVETDRAATVPAASGSASAHAVAVAPVPVTVELSPARARVLRVLGPGIDSAIPVPQAGIDDALHRLLRRMLAGCGVLLAVGLLGAAVLAHRVASPLRELSDAARRVGAGALGEHVEPRGGREIEDAMRAFNGMSSRLRDLDAESRLLREREHLSELGEVARGLAHGLRNPLNALGLAVDEIARARGEDTQPLADAARRQIRRMDGAVRSFLALATDGSATACERVDILALAEDVALEALQDARGRVFVTVTGETATVEGVRAALRSAVQALVVNAVEASPDGAQVGVRVEPTEGAAGARLVVEDSGPGLAPEVRERLFTPHVTTKATGAGMGLFLAHRIAVVRHGGSLRLEAREPCGTRAVIDLPGCGVARAAASSHVG